MTTTIINLLLNYWKQIAISVSALIILTTAYFHIYNSGYDACEQKYIKATQERETRYYENTSKITEEHNDFVNMLDAYYGLPETDSLQTPAANRSGVKTGFRCQQGELQKTLDKATELAERAYKQLEIDRK